MRPILNALTHNARMLRSRASRPAIIGTLIAIAAVFFATVLAAWLPGGNDVNLGSLYEAQRTNSVLWILDGMPFLFAIWGQYTSSLIAYEAGALVMDQTEDLRAQTMALENQLAHGVMHDHLTGLPNRLLLIDRLEQAINSAQREKREMAVLLLDLDSFKDINDTLGHFNGDRLLKSVAARLQSTVSDPVTLARLGGDEFALVMPRMDDREEARIMAKRIQRSLDTPFALDGLTLDVKASIGATIYPVHGSDADTLLKLADVAMYSAKEQRVPFVMYSQRDNRHSAQKLTLMGELRQAINNDELELRYQPCVNLQTNDINRVEALLRWHHPVHGLLGPDEFIPMAERTGLIRELSLHVLNQALSQAAIWRAEGRGLSVAINLSARTLLDVELPNLIAGALARHDLPPEALIIEITETTLMEDKDRALEILRRISVTGVRLTIDDFGTGYSSMAYLKKLPVSEIKIDRSFVLDMHENDNDRVIVNATIQLAHNLGLRVVAEGVETELALELVRDMGCDFAQGFLFTQALAAQPFVEWLDRTLKTASA